MIVTLPDYRDDMRKFAEIALIVSQYPKVLLRLTPKSKGMSISQQYIITSADDYIKSSKPAHAWSKVILSHASIGACLEFSNEYDDDFVTWFLMKYI